MANLPHSYMSPSEICLRLAVAVAADVPWPVLEHCMPLRTPPCFLRHWARAFPTLHQGFYAWQLWDLFKQRLHVLIITTISEVQRAFFQAFRLSNNKWGFRSSPSTTQANFQPVHLQIKASSPQHRQYSLTLWPLLREKAIISQFHGQHCSGIQNRSELSHGYKGPGHPGKKCCLQWDTAIRGSGTFTTSIDCPIRTLNLWGNRTSKVLKHTFASAKFNTSSTWWWSSLFSRPLASKMSFNAAAWTAPETWASRQPGVVPIHCHHVSGTMGSYVWAGYEKRSTQRITDGTHYWLVANMYHITTTASSKSNHPSCTVTIHNNSYVPIYLRTLSFTVVWRQASPLFDVFQKNSDFSSVQTLHQH